MPALLGRRTYGSTPFEWCTCEPLIFNHFESLNIDFPLEWVSIKYNTCALSPNLNHNANNLPLWTWWQPQDPQCHSPPLKSRAKGYAPPENMLKSLLIKKNHNPPYIISDRERDRDILVAIFRSSSMFSFWTFFYKIFYNANNALYMLPLNLCH